MQPYLLKVIAAPEIYVLGVIYVLGDIFPKQYEKAVTGEKCSL